MTNDRQILIIDAWNLFMRSWSAYPTMSTNGYQMGGCIGFMKTLSRLAYEIGPKVIYVVWEAGGSRKRRALFSGYKMNRRPEKLNRFYEDDIPDTEENKQHQVVTLVSMLKNAPVCQLYVADCEGDDVIAYLARVKFNDQNKVIASSDKDMYQLLDEHTKIYNLHRKTYVVTDTVVNEFRVHPRNFAIAKALCGDPSDNIPGIKGLGFKTASKRIPLLSHEGDVLVDDIVSYCHSHLDESKVYAHIIEHEEELRRNYRLVYLNGGMLSQHQASVIDNGIATYTPKVNKRELMRHLIEEGVNDFDVTSFLFSFNGIEGLTNVSA